MAQRNGETHLQDSRKTDRLGFAPYHMRLAVQARDITALLQLKVEEVSQLRSVREELCKEAYDLLIGVHYGADPPTQEPSKPSDFEALEEGDIWRAALWGALQHAWRQEQNFGGNPMEPEFDDQGDEETRGAKERQGARNAKAKGPGASRPKKRR